jgi:hypothetical protein
VNYGIKPLLHIKDSRSAEQEEQFARGATLATAAKDETIIDSP